MTAISLDLPLWPRQKEALVSTANEQLFGGASEGGKSYFARVALILAGLQCTGLQMTLVRKKFDDILSNHLEGNRGFRAMLYPLSSRGVVDVSQKGIRFPNDNTLSFKHCQDERQFDSAQGNENQILVLEEATQIAERLIRTFRGWVRMTPEHLKAQPKFWQNKLPWALYTANPVGQSVPFFRRQFINSRSPFVIEPVDGFRRQFVPSKVSDNPAVDVEAHKARLAAIGDPSLARALDEGDWDAIVGEFFPEWDESRHVVPDFTPPQHWFRFRGFDWGSAEPFCVYWVAVSDGEVFQDHVGRQLWFPRGCFIVYREWYGCDAEYPEKGIRMRNDDIASGIVQRSEIGHQRVITLTDSLPFQDRGGEGIDETFLRCGVPLTRGDDSRVVGWSQMRARLIGQYHPFTKRKEPMLVVTESCKAARDYIPALPRHPSEVKREDAAEHGETTHACDTLRLICMAHTVIRDLAVPTTQKIQRALEAQKTMKQIVNSNGRAIFR